MEKVFASPMTYRQGKNVVWNHLEDILAFGVKGLLVTDRFVYQMIGEKLLEELTDRGGDLAFWLVEEPRIEQDFDYVVALGVVERLI